MGKSRGGAWGLDTPGKSQVAIGFLRNSGTDPSREAIGPRGPIASRRRPVWPSVKYVDDQNTCQDPLTGFGSAHGYYKFITHNSQSISVRRT